MTDPIAKNMTDRDAIAVARWDQRTRLAIRSLLNDQLIDEHRRDPRGLHSDTLKRVLNYLRRSSALTPYVVICTQPFREWRVARLTGVSGQAPIFVDEQRFNSEAGAMHAVFLLRVQEIMRD
jgi:branched-chain amino acid transport system permease protein